MPFADLFSNSLIAPVLNWAKNQNIPEAAGSLLAAYAVPALAGGLVKKQHRGQVQGMLAQPFITNAFQALQRPQQAKEFLLKHRIQEEGLTPVAPYPGATPVEKYNGIPMYTPQTIGQKFAGLFPSQSPYPKPLTTPQFTPPGTAIEPSSLQAIPDVKPLLPSQQIVASMPANKASLPVVLALMQKKEEEQALLDRYKLGTKTMDAYHQAHPEMVQIPSLTADGFPTTKFEQPRAATRPLVRDMPVTTSDGQTIMVPSVSHDGGNTWSGIGNGQYGRPMWNPNAGAGTQRPLFQKKETTKNGQQVTVTMTSEDNGQTWHEVAELEGTARNSLTEHAQTRDLDALSKETADITKDLTPFRALLKKYPDGKIPTPELLKAIPLDGPFAQMRDSSLIQASLARLAEIAQEKQHILGQGGQTAPAQGSTKQPASSQRYYLPNTGAGSYYNSLFK